jgi:isopentenyl diphosphate isomerase/L-lactate dehydrogenase-like FMN-dependent dehydrogenase
VVEMMRNMVAELDLTMALAGCTSTAEINADLLRPVSAGAGV